MRLLQPCIAMATVSLLHCAERLLLVDTPKSDGAEVVQNIEKGHEKRNGNESVNTIRSWNETVTEIV